MNNFTIDDTSISYFVDKSIYTKNVILKCTYWYAGEYRISITDHDDKFYHIRFSPNTISKQWNQIANKLIIMFERDLIDYSLRDIIDEETKNIKELIIAKAFAPFDIIRNDEKK